MVPTIDPKLKIESLPEWDGNHDTAIKYFWDVVQIANLLGWLPRALAFWLPTRLKKGSQVYLWFSTLPAERQAEMRSHYLVYLQVLKDSYLGKKWRLRMNLQFEQQSFRQAGHEHESAQTFLGRHIRYARLLTNTDNGGLDEIFVVMSKAPIVWSTILVLENIKSIEELYERVNEHEDELYDTVTCGSRDVVTLHNLSSTLHRLGFQNTSSPAAPFHRPKRVNFTEAEDNPDELGSELVEEVTMVEPGKESPSDEELTLRSVYQTLTRRQRPPPKGGYPYPKNDHVSTKMGKLPPSPCKVCRSDKHWDWECPNWAVYLEKARRGLLVAASGEVMDETELLYHSAYIVLMDGLLEENSF
jgi:hypothetical protein